MPRRASLVDRQLGHRIRAHRLLVSMTQQQLADRLGVTCQQVQKYENGTNRICASRLYAIANALHTPVQSFFDDPRKRTPKSAATIDYDLVIAFVRTRDGKKLNKAFARVPNRKVRQAIVQLARVLEEDARSDNARQPRKWPLP
jgi:transcriptional regulator with XRE-family HTH domain